MSGKAAQYSELAETQETMQELYSDLEEDEESLYSEEDEDELQIIEDGPSATPAETAPPPSPPQTAQQSLTQPRGRAARRAPRWDQISSKKLDSGKPRSSNSPPSASKKAKLYKSWRVHKIALVRCLAAAGGNVAFVRRYMLFKLGVNVPKNVIHYYNSRYCSDRRRQQEEEGGRRQEN